MRVSLQLNRDLLAAAEQIASRRGQTLLAFVEDALRTAVSRGVERGEKMQHRPGSRERRRVELPTFRGEGLRPGVNLDDSAALLDLMESSSHAPD